MTSTHEVRIWQKAGMSGSGAFLQKISMRAFPKHKVPQIVAKTPQVTSGQQTSPTKSLRKQGKLRSPRQKNATIVCEDYSKERVREHRIDIGEESNLLGYVVHSGKLILDKRISIMEAQTGVGAANQAGVDAQLTSKALIWGSHILLLKDVISVSFNAGVRHFTVHSYPTIHRSCMLSCILKPKRSRKDFCFLAPTPEEAILWVTGLSDQHCFVNYLPHPMKHGDDFTVIDPFFEQYIKTKTPPKVLVILNPRSGHGRSNKVFYGKVEPIFKLAGFKMDVVKTERAGHARDIAATVDLSTFPDGIICVGGDGIVNEVLNGLFRRIDHKEAMSIPIGVIPAGSDNSLVWTILGVRDPVSAAITIVKGGLTPTDVFVVEWLQSGDTHLGTTVTYFGFVSDVLELSEKYQKRYGPLRYFVAGFLKFWCLPSYTFEVEYLPISEESYSEGIITGDEENMHDDMHSVHAEVPKSRRECLPRASSLSSIDSIMTPSRMSGDLDTSGSNPANCEPSEYVRGLDPKSKHLSLGKSDRTTEPEEVLHPQMYLSATRNRPRTRSRSKADKSGALSTSTNDTRFSLGSSMNDKEDVSSTVSDPGPIWDPEPRIYGETTLEMEDPIQLPGPTYDVELGQPEEVSPSYEEKWVTKKGSFLGILICNHPCRTVQSSQVVAPKAEHNDNSLDLILVRGSGRLRLAKFFMCLQLGNHLSLPYVEYIKVKAVKVKPGVACHNGCGIDGELLRVDGQVLCCLLPDQCRLLGVPTEGHTHI